MKYIPLVLPSFSLQEDFRFGSHLWKWAVQRVLAFAAVPSLFLKTNTNKKPQQNKQNTTKTKKSHQSPPQIKTKQYPPFELMLNRKILNNIFLKSLFKSVTYGSAAI